MFVDLLPMYGINYKAGQIFFTRTEGGFLSGGIEFHTGDQNILKDKLTSTTHVGICTGACSGIEMQPSGLKRCNLKDYFTSPKTRIIFREPKLLEALSFLPLADEILKAEQAGGIRYDYLLLFGLSLTTNPLSDKILPNRFKKWVQKKLNCENRWICSEAVQVLYRRAKYHDDPTNIVTPQELFFSDWLKPLKETLPERLENLVLNTRDS